jgi:hypothetical protein
MTTINRCLQRSCVKLPIGIYRLQLFIGGLNSLFLDKISLQLPCQLKNIPCSDK